VAEAAATLAALPAAVALAVAISAVVASAQLQVSLVARVSGAAIARRQRSTVAAFEQHRLFVAVVHTLPGEMLADQAAHHVSTMVAVECPV
jgi:hypothetical protein